MRYKFRCDVTAADLWLLSMHRIYHSMVGVCGVVFAVSAIALTARFWAVSTLPVKLLLIAACLLVPVLQPVGVYIRSRGQQAQLPKNMELWFGDQEIYVQADGKTDHVSWKKIARVIREKNMILLLLADGRGYMLTNRELGEEKEEFYRYLVSQI